MLLQLWLTMIIDIQHALFVFSMGNKLNLAPIGDSPHNVLDFATGKERLGSRQIPSIFLIHDLGTGIWAIDFG